uniref:5'-methylthioadenosine phosphorylase (MtaP) n=1 Tax=uncultured marine group II/III euryarchaeote KM3_27_D02 TaxID=1456428 RepID=A0A075GWI5_9EURY|nr:5'-methylthioadenosine phosphorylase (mtaP) [uncultured marine group II/III euryarchaeote KM3_27_D02]
MQRIAVIGGTGMKQLVEEADFCDADYRVQQVDSLVSENRYGEVPLEVMVLRRYGAGADEMFCGEGEHPDECRIFVIHRHHGDGKTTPPHLVNYHANVTAAADCNPDVILSIQSVGGIDPNFPPGIVGMAEHTLDFSGGPITFSEEDAHHADMTHHYPETLRGLLRPILASQSNEEVLLDHVVAHMTGPQFETPAEVEALHRLGATAVSMTISPEAKLIGELGIPHVGLIASSNWAAGKTPGDSAAAIDHHSVEAKAADMRGTIWQCITSLLEN